MLKGITLACLFLAVSTGYGADDHFTGGLIVHLGCGDGTKTIELRTADNVMVHGLDTSKEKVDQARALIQSKGLYGKIAIEQFDGKTLPYIDNLVNRIVADKTTVPEEEILLSSRGVTRRCRHRA